jgi:hypothetical protein
VITEYYFDLIALGLCHEKSFFSIAYNVLRIGVRFAGLSVPAKRSGAKPLSAGKMTLSRC